MSTLTERQAAFESKFAHDEQLKFRVEMRRNKLVGLWAAALLGKDDAEAYAKEVVAADFEEAGNEDVVRKIAADFQAAGLPSRPMMSEKRWRNSWARPCARWRPVENPTLLQPFRRLRNCAKTIVPSGHGPWPDSALMWPDSPASTRKDPQALAMSSACS